MIQFNNLDYQYQAGSKPSFGSLTQNPSRKIGGQQPVEAKAVNNPFAAATSNKDNSLVSRLDRIDAQTLAPNTKSPEQGNFLYAMA